MAFPASAAPRTVSLLVLILLPLAAAPAGQAPVATDVEQKVQALLAQMTLEEKVGQLNQYSSTFDVTGPAPGAGAAKQRYEQLRAGQVGSMLNVLGARATRRAQQLA